MKCFNFVGFMLVLSLVGLFKAKLIAGDLLAERLVRLVELKTWREINICLLDLC